MAKVENNDVDELAFRLYAERVAGQPAQANGEASAAWAYRKAEDFISVRDKVKSGDVKVLAVSKLADACAPKLKRTHPHNIVSQRFAADNGGEARVLSMLKEIHTWLLQHPAADAQYDLLDWDAATTNLARNIIPNYVQN